MRLTQFPSALANRPLRQRRTSPAFLRYGIRAALAALLVIVVVSVAAILVVLSGPTEIGAIRERVVGALEQALGEDYAVTVGKTLVDVDPALGLVIRLDDVEVRDSREAVVARVPSTRLAVNPLSLLRFRVDVRTVELSGAELSFARSPDGQVYLGNAATVHAAAGKQPDPPTDAPRSGADPDGGFPDLFVAMKILDRGLEPSINAAVDAGFARFSLVGGKIDVWDPAWLKQRSFPQTDLTVSVDPGSRDLNVTFATAGYGGRWSATFDRAADAATGGRSMTGVFSQLTLADIFPKLGDNVGWLSADVPLYGRAAVRYGKDGAVEDASMRLDIGASEFRFGDERRETVLLDEANIKLRWDIPNKTVIVEPSAFYFGQTRGVVSGWIKPDGAPADRRYAFNLESRGAIIAPTDSPELPMVAERIAVSGVADLPKKLLAFDKATIVTPVASIAASGSLGFEGVSPSLTMAASFSPMSAAAVKQLWVPFIAPGARRWFLQHVMDGRVTAARFEAAVPPGILWTGKRLPIPEDKMRLDVRIEDASFTTFGDLPPIINASGNAVLAGSTFGVDLEKGEVKVPSGETVRLDAGAFAVNNTVQRHPDGVIEVQLSGDAGPMGEIANSKPLFALDRRSISAADLTGKGDASVSVKLPLRSGITEADVDWRINVNAKDLGSSKPIEGRKIDDADVTIAVTPDDVTIKGKAKIDGVDADVSLSQPITRDGEIARTGDRQLHLTLDAAARKKLGMGLDQILGGTIGVTVTNIEDGSQGQRYDLDLKRARLTLPGLGWSKGVGVPARLSFDLKPAEGGFAAENIMLEGDGFGFSGSANLDKGYGLISADIDHFSLRKGDSMSFKLARTKGGYQISADGKVFDMRSVISHLREQATSETDAPDLSISARIGKVIGYNQETITDATLSMMSAGGAMRKFSFTGAIGGAPISASYVDGPDGTTLFATADDAGRLFRFNDIYTRFDGGRLTLSGQGVGDGPLVGRLEIDDFNILNEPAMQRVAANSPKAPNAVNPTKVHFDRMVVRYRKTSQAITIDEALLRGASVGATFNGRYDLAKSYVTINGVYLPAYAFNNAVSKIPIVGLVLSGGFSEGLFGVTFRIEGPIAKPRVLVNPLSAVAPGIFRKIFEFH